MGDVVVRSSIPSERIALRSANFLTTVYRLSKIYANVAQMGRNSWQFSSREVLLLLLTRTVGRSPMCKNQALY